MKSGTWILGLAVCGMASAAWAAPIQARPDPSSPFRAFEQVQYRPNAHPTGSGFRPNEMPSYDRNYDRAQRRGFYPQSQPEDYEFGRPDRASGPSRRIDSQDLNDRQQGLIPGAKADPANGYVPPERNATVEDYLRAQRTIQNNLNKSR